MAQPLDVGVNKPIKSTMRAAWNEWMEKSEPIWTPSGNRQRPSYQTIIDMIEDSLHQLDANLVKRAFECCGLSTEQGILSRFYLINSQLQSVLCPDPLNVSRETLHHLDTAISSPVDTALENIENYLDFAFPEAVSTTVPKSSTPRPRVNRRFQQFSRPNVQPF